MTALPWFQRPIDTHAVADAYLAWLGAHTLWPHTTWATLTEYHHNPIDGPDAFRGLRRGR